jgi:hypothetical protein
MIQVFKDNKLSATFEKPESFDLLFEKICKVYRAEPERVVIAWLEENNDKTFLERDEEYRVACENRETVDVVAFVKGKEWTARQLKVAGAGLGVVLFFSHFWFELPFWFVPFLAWSLVYANFEMVYYILWEGQSLMYWAPFTLPFVYFVFLCWHWLNYVARVKRVSKTRVFYFCFFGSNLIPNSFGFLSSMIAILWMVQALLNIALHKMRPLSSKDMNFLSVLGIHLVCAVARVIYFY